MNAEEAVNIGNQVLDRGKAIAAKLDEILEQDGEVKAQRALLKDLQDRPGPEVPITFDNATHYAAYLVHRDKRERQLNDGRGEVHEAVKTRQRLAQALVFDHDLLDLREGEVVRLRHTYGGKGEKHDIYGGTYLVQAKVVDSEEGLAEVGCWLA